jgi:hypothetical protein
MHEVLSKKKTLSEEEKNQIREIGVVLESESEDCSDSEAEDCLL